MKGLQRVGRKSIAWINGLRIVLAILTVWALGVAPASAQSFFQGKTIRLIVPFSPGGGTDTYARLVSRHWGNHITGKPSIIVENRPGGGGALAFNFLFSQAEPDGLTVGVASEGVPARRLLRLPGHTYQFEKMHLIAASSGSTVHYARQDLGVTSIADLPKVKGQIKVGDTHKGSTIAITAKLIFELLEVNYLQVYGYGSYGEARLALLRGEVNVSGGDAFDYTSAIAPLEKKGEIKVLFQSGLFDDKGNILRHPRMPHIPIAEEAFRDIFGKAPSGKKWEAMKGMTSINTLGKSFWAPPGTPMDRLRLLEDGYRKMLQSSAYQKDALKILGSKDNALLGEEARPALQQFFGLPKEIVDLYR